jgi:acyl-CoA synthetase (AMP-forming)/AMP-acid ligase II
VFEDWIRYHAIRTPDAPAVVVPGKAVSYGTFNEDINRAAHELRDLRCDPQETVSLHISRPYLYCVVVVALARLGIASSGGGDVEAPVRISDKVSGGEGSFRLTPEIIDRIFKGSRQAPLRRRVDPDALGTVFRTSGTTGDSKRVAMSWRAIEANLLRYVALNAGVNGRWLGGTGMGTIAGYLITLAAWVGGQCALVGVPVNADAVIRYRPRFAILIAIQLQELLEGLQPGMVDWPLRIGTGGAALQPPLARRIREVLTTDLISGYGATEVAGVTSAGLDLLERISNLGGYLLPDVEVRIVDDSGASLPVGEPGRIVIKSDTLASGYLGRPDLTAETFRDGWFYSNDVGRLSDDGLLFIDGRLDDLMNITGHKVLPSWVEDPALDCPGVIDVAVFPILQDNGLQACGLAMVKGENFQQAELAKRLKDRLRKLSKIRIFDVQSIPRNAMGKIDRRELQRLHAAGQLSPHQSTISSGE